MLFSSEEKLLHKITYHNCKKDLPIQYQTFLVVAHPIIHYKNHSAIKSCFIIGLLYSITLSESHHREDLRRNVGLSCMGFIFHNDTFILYIWNYWSLNEIQEKAFYFFIYLKVEKYNELSQKNRFQSVPIAAL